MAILWTNATVHRTASTLECHFVDKCCNYRTPSTQNGHFVDKCCNSPHSIHAEVPFCGQKLQFTALHPRMSAILWTNATVHRTSSTQKHHFVDKRCGAPYFIHTRYPLCGRKHASGTQHPLYESFGHNSTSKCGVHKSICYLCRKI